MTMQGNKGLFFFDKTTDGDATSVDIQRGVIDHSTIQRHPVQSGLMGGSME